MFVRLTGRRASPESRLPGPAGGARPRDGPHGHAPLFHVVRAGAAGPPGTAGCGTCVRRSSRTRAKCYLRTPAAAAAAEPKPPRHAAVHLRPRLPVGRGQPHSTVQWVDFGGPAATEEAGSSAAVVLVHGLVGRTSNWVGIGRASSAGCRACDLPGDPALGRGHQRQPTRSSTRLGAPVVLSSELQWRAAPLAHRCPRAGRARRPGPAPAELAATFTGCTAGAVGANGRSQRGASTGAALRRPPDTWQRRSRLATVAPGTGGRVPPAGAPARAPGRRPDHARANGPVSAHLHARRQLPRPRAEHWLNPARMADQVCRAPRRVEPRRSPRRRDRHEPVELAVHEQDRTARSRDERVVRLGARGAPRSSERAAPRKSASGSGSERRQAASSMPAATTSSSARDGSAKHSAMVPSTRCRSVKRAL